jgi:hypothetical protein
MEWIKGGTYISGRIRRWQMDGFKEFPARTSVERGGPVEWIRMGPGIEDFQSEEAICVKESIGE